MKRTAAFILAIISILCLASCGKSTGYTEVSLGDDLPVWEFTDTLYAEKLPGDAEETGLVGVYKTDKADKADIYIYRYDKDGLSLEEFGGQQAGEHKVFCNMTSFKDVPCANVTYYDTAYGDGCIVRSYIFEDGDEFVKLCSAHKTNAISLAGSDYTIRMISGYTEAENTDSVFPYEEVYTYEDEYLPTVRVRRFAKDCFTPDTYDAALMPGTGREQYEAYAADGWTLEEAVSLYDDNYELLKGELINRNGFDVGFIGYIDKGIFYVRALIDCGDEYIMLCAENDAVIFQHVVNALIDTIKVE